MTESAVVVSAVRTPVARARRGALATTPPTAYGAAAVAEAMARVPKLDPEDVDDVLIGCAMPEGEQGLNVARQVALRAGLPDAVPAATVNRFCSSGLQTIAMGAQAIVAGAADVVVAGGTESMTHLPMSGLHFVPDPVLLEKQPDAYISMGLTAERVAERWKVSREDQDAFALGSHQRALAALDDGRFADEVVALDVETIGRDEDGRPAVASRRFERDEGPRPDTSAEGLAALKAVFRKGGTVTAGNSSQMSDGAAAAVVMGAGRAERLGIEPLGRFVGYAVAGVEPGIMGIGPVAAVPRVLERAGLTLDDIGLVELNEAFASQSLAVIRELGLDPGIVNVSGGAIALGHPLGCTGAKLTATLLHEMRRRGVRYGMVTMCIGGGMGAAGVFENPAAAS